MSEGRRRSVRLIQSPWLCNRPGKTPIYVDLGENPRGEVAGGEGMDAGHERLAGFRSSKEEKSVIKKTSVAVSSDDDDDFVTPGETFSAKKVHVETESHTKRRKLELIIKKPTFDKIENSLTNVVDSAENEENDRKRKRNESLGKDYIATGKESLLESKANRWTRVSSNKNITLVEDKAVAKKKTLHDKKMQSAGQRKSKNVRTYNRYIQREIVNLKPYVLRMDWQTNLNSVDSGIFVMRHMESYMGNLYTWKAGLPKEIDHPRQEAVINKLRIIYCHMMLMWSDNRKRQVLLDRATKLAKSMKHAK